MYANIFLYLLIVAAKHGFPIGVKGLRHDMFQCGRFIFHIACYIVIFPRNSILKAFKRNI